MPSKAYYQGLLKLCGQKLADAARKANGDGYQELGVTRQQAIEIWQVRRDCLLQWQAWITEQINNSTE